VVLLCAACGWWCVCGAGGAGVWVGWCASRGRVRGAGRSVVVGVAGLRRLGYAGLLAGRLVLCVAGLVRRRRRAVRGDDFGFVSRFSRFCTSWLVSMILRAVARFYCAVVLVVLGSVLLWRFVGYSSQFLLLFFSCLGTAVLLLAATAG
jgi:hypothetical protein